jgi:DNA polymerase III epsilon subunit-like protein
MSRRDYFITVDVEAANTSPTGKPNTVDPSNALVYDIGWIVHDNYGNIYSRNSYIISDVFGLMPDVMESAYYAEKIPIYNDRIEKSKQLIDTFFGVRRKFLNDVEKYNIKAIIAYNARFDYMALNATTRYLSKSACRYWCYGVEWWDSWKMCQDVVAKQKKYIRFCEENGYMTKHKKPRPQVKAETVYRFMNKDPDFNESHTGLEDAEIEVKIYVFCRNKHKKMRRKLWED